MWHTSYIFQVLRVKIILYLILYSARSRKVTYIATHFFGLQSREIVNFGYSLSRTLFGTQPEFDIHRTFSFFGLQSKKSQLWSFFIHTLFGTRQKCDIHRRFFKFTEWKKSTLIILYLVLYSTRGRNVTNIVHFSGFKSENSQVWSFFIS